jgi:hypothetical protein
MPKNIWCVRMTDKIVRGEIAIARGGPLKRMHTERTQLAWRCWRQKKLHEKILEETDYREVRYRLLAQPLRDHAMQEHEQLTAWLRRYGLMFYRMTRKV